MHHNSQLSNTQQQQCQESPLLLNPALAWERAARTSLTPHDLSSNTFGWTMRTGWLNFGPAPISLGPSFLLLSSTSPIGPRRFLSEAQTQGSLMQMNEQPGKILQARVKRARKSILMPAPIFSLESSVCRSSLYTAWQGFPGPTSKVEPHLMRVFPEKGEES